MPSADRRSVRPEFSRRIAVNRQVDPRQSFAIEATAGERAALAERFGLVSLDRLVASGTVDTLAGGTRAILRAGFEARVIQTCVVTLEPFAADLAENFVLEYAADGQPVLPAEVEIDPEEADPPEPLDDGAIDVGEAVAEHVALALDPYPRAPGAELAQGGDSSAETAADSPFKALSGLVKKRRN